LLLAIGDNHLRAGRADPIKRFARNGHSEQLQGIVKPIFVEFVCDNVSLWPQLKHPRVV
jgi:hypothetical protein